MRGRWLARTADVKKFSYSQLKEFPPHLSSTEGSEIEH